MSAGIYLAYSGAAAAQADVELIANNVANASTTGFRRDQTLFDTIMGASLPFSRVAAGQVDLAPGTHELTKNPLDVAIDGEGFFVVEDAEGNEVYTRRGDFTINAERELVLPSGAKVMGSSGPIAIPSGATAHFSEDGTLQTDQGPIDRLRIVAFDEPGALHKLGGSLIAAGPEALPRDLENARVAPGFIESSNVNLAAEMVALITATRSFEAALQSLRVSDQMTQSLVQLQT